MYDKRAEQDAKRWGILDRMRNLENALMQIQGIVHVEFDIRDYGSGIHQVILIPKYFIDPQLEAGKYFAARRNQLERICQVCKKHDLFPSGDAIEDMGEHWYIVRTCGNTWPKI